MLEKSAKDYFLLLSSWTFGIWLLYVGLSKWTGEVSGFVVFIQQSFANTWIPLPLLKLTAWIILVAEPVLAVWLLSGVKQRLAWTGVALLMFMLMFGQTVIEKYVTVANNWQYLVLAIVCAALSEPKTNNTSSVAS